MHRMAGLALAAMGMTFGANAQAGIVDEAKVGVLAHNIQVLNGGTANKEDGPIIDLQVNFRSPGFLHWAGAPSPYVSVSPNVSGDTNFAAVGLEWRWAFADRWALTPGLGYAVQDGATNNPFPNGTAKSTAYNRDHVLYGSKDVFRTSLGLQREFGPHWRGELMFLHYSHGQILGSGRNQGVDQAGVRIGYKFGD